MGISIDQIVIQTGLSRDVVEYHVKCIEQFEKWYKQMFKGDREASSLITNTPQKDS